MNNMTIYEKDRILRESLVTRTVYCGLGDTSEVTSRSYKRVAVTFTAPAQGQTVNRDDIEFPVATEEWGKISKVALYDAPSAGNKIWEGSPEVTKTIGTASQYKIPKGYLIVRLG